MCRVKPPPRFVSTSLLHSSSVWSRKYFLLKIPALLIKISTPPNLSITCATIALTCSASRISACIPRTLPPASLIFSTMLSIPLLSRATTTTLAPSSAKSLAVAAPMPLLPPVRIVTLSLTEAIFKIWYTFSLTLQCRVQS